MEENDPKRVRAAMEAYAECHTIEEWVMSLMRIVYESCKARQQVTEERNRLHAISSIFDPM
jgi:hypothetical protein